jgi:hypothetical protein
MSAERALTEIERRCLMCSSEGCYGRCGSGYRCFDCGTPEVHKNINDCPMCKRLICKVCRIDFSSIRKFKDHLPCGDRPGYQYVGKDFAELIDYLRLKKTGCYNCFSWRCDDNRHIVGDRIKALLFQKRLIEGHSFKSTVSAIYKTEETRNEFFAQVASKITSNKRQRTE